MPWFCKTTLLTSGSVDTMIGVPNMCVLNTLPYLQSVERHKINKIISFFKKEEKKTQEESVLIFFTSFDHHH